MKSYLLGIFIICKLHFIVFCY